MIPFLSLVDFEENVNIEYLRGDNFRSYYLVLSMRTTPNVLSNKDFKKC